MLNNKIEFYQKNVFYYVSLRTFQPNCYIIVYWQFDFAAPNSLEEKTLDELDELEDEEDKRVLEEYRQNRIAELKELANKSKYGEVQEISAEDYVKEVNNAGEDVLVILHLYKSGYDETK